MRTKMIVLSSVVFLVVAGWTGAWFFVRHMVADGLDKAVADLAGQGVAVTCPERSLTGWPFRISVGCVKPVLRLADGTTVEASRLEAIGVVDDPQLVIAALESPVTVTLPDGSAGEARFASLKASIRTLDGKVTRVSVAGEGLVVEGGPAGLTYGRLNAERGELHVRQAENPADLDVALTLVRASATMGQTEVLPAAADAGIAAVVRQVALIGPGPEKMTAWSSAGGEIGLSQAALSVGDTRIEASGTGTVAGDGQAKATLTATATGINWLTDQAKAGKPLPPALAALGSAFLLIGRSGEGEGNPRILDVVVENGAVSANGLPLGAVPPVFRADAAGAVN